MVGVIANRAAVIGTGIRPLKASLTCSARHIHPLAPSKFSLMITRCDQSTFSPSLNFQSLARPTRNRSVLRLCNGPSRRRRRANDFSSAYFSYSSLTKHRQTQAIRTILSEASNTESLRNPLFRLLVQSLNNTLLTPRSLPLVPRWISPQHYSFTLSECFGHSSFILVAISYATDDFLQLRLLAVLGSTSMLFFTYFHPHGRVLWLPLKWNMLFIAINSYRIGRVLLDRYLANEISPELKKFREDHLYVVDLVDFYKLIKIAKEEVYEEGELVLHQVCVGGVQWLLHFYFKRIIVVSNPCLNVSSLMSNPWLKLC